VLESLIFSLSMTIPFTLSTINFSNPTETFFVSPKIPQMIFSLFFWPRKKQKNSNSYISFDQTSLLSSKGVKDIPTKKVFETYFHWCPRKGEKSFLQMILWSYAFCTSKSLTNRTLIEKEVSLGCERKKSRHNWKTLKGWSLKLPFLCRIFLQVLKLKYRKIS